MISRSRFRLALDAIILSAIAFSCMESKLAYAHTIRRQSTADDMVLLEIVREARGMVPYRGKWLYFRLHRSGRVEYETLTEPGESHELRPAKYEMQLKPKDRTEIIRLIEDPGFLDAREYYKKVWPSVDASFITTIISSHKQAKRIALENFYPDLKNSYPEALLTLMRMIEGLLKTTPLARAC